MSWTSRVVTVDSPAESRQRIRLPERFTIETASGAGAYKLAWQYCASPICPCSTMVGRATPEDSSEAAGNEPFEIAVDTFTSSLEAPETADPRALAVTETWSDETWDSISAAFFSVKLQQTEQMDLSKLGAEIEFPVKEIQGQGTLVGWYDIVRFDRSLQVDLDGEVFLIDDQYCVKKGCGCHHAVLSFAAAVPKADDSGLEDGSKDGLEDESEGAMSSVDLDLRTAEWQSRDVEDGAPVGPLMQQAMAISGFRGLLRRRRKVLRAMYRNHLTAIDYQPPQPIVRPEDPTVRAARRVPGPPTRAAVAAAAAAANVGRNDLCPCGSGKKYKKCCLRASRARK